MLLYPIVDVSGNDPSDKTRRSITGILRHRYLAPVDSTATTSKKVTWHGERRERETKRRRCGVQLDLRASPSIAVSSPFDFYTGEEEDPLHPPTTTRSSHSKSTPMKPLPSLVKFFKLDRMDRRRLALSFGYDSPRGVVEFEEKIREEERRIKRATAARRRATRMEDEERQSKTAGYDGDALWAWVGLETSKRRETAAAAAAADDENNNDAAAVAAVAAAAAVELQAKEDLDRLGMEPVENLWQDSMDDEDLDDDETGGKEKMGVSGKEDEAPMQPVVPETKPFKPAKEESDEEKSRDFDGFSVTMTIKEVSSNAIRRNAYRRAVHRRHGILL